jgi:small subunit ribosomal protein S5
MAKNIKKKIHEKRVRPDECGELVERSVSVRRVTKVVKGGRRFGFSVLVVVGDSQGHIGYGIGKSAEVPDAVRKAVEGGKKMLIKVPMKGTTITHKITGSYGPTKVELMPASAGTGVIAGASARAVLESAGVKDIRTKVIGSTNPYNVVRAVFNGMLELMDPERVAAVRGVPMETIGYQPF